MSTNDDPAAKAEEKYRIESIHPNDTRVINEFGHAIAFFAGDDREANAQRFVNSFAPSGVTAQAQADKPVVIEDVKTCLKEISGLVKSCIQQREREGISDGDLICIREYARRAQSALAKEQA